MSLENKMEHGSPHFSAVTAIISSLCTAWLQKTHQSHCNGHRLIDMVQWSTLGLLLVQLYHYWWFIGFMIDGLWLMVYLRKFPQCPGSCGHFHWSFWSESLRMPPWWPWCPVDYYKKHLFKSSYLYTNTMVYNVLHKKRPVLAGPVQALFAACRIALWWPPLLDTRREAARLVAGRGWKMETWRCVAKAVTCKSAWWRDVKCWYVLIIAGR
jgi:hypothetical protein